MNKLLFVILSVIFMGCSSSSERYPASRAGRPYQEPRPMNHRATDTESLYQACIKEWPELYCRNRMGR